MIKRFLFTCFFLVGFSLVASAQKANELLCKVLDIETKQSVSFATIKFEGEQNGVIADEDGEFRLPLNYNSTNKTIIISSIGFETLNTSVGAFKSDTINIIYLKPRVEALSAVLVTGNVNTNTNSKGLSAKSIIKNAIGRIPTNYPNTPHSYISYYRDYQLINNNYYNLTEAILESFDAGFNTSKYANKNNATALYSYNLNQQFYQDTLLLNSVYGKSKSLSGDNTTKLGTEIQNELEILNIHNPIRNYNKNSFSFIYVFRDDFINNHLFKISSIKYVEDTPLYEIQFVTREAPTVRYMGSGKIYISKSNFAIHKIEYRVFINRNYQSTRSQDNPFANLNNKPKNILFEVTVEYKAKGNKMFLNYMTFNNLFVIKEPNPFRVEDFDFNPNDKCFYIAFNKPIDEASIKRRSNFKLRYKNKKLIVKEILLIDNKTVKIEVVDWSAGTATNPSAVKSEDFSYRLKKIKDTFGTLINKESKLAGYQFREFFTQEVFENKNPQEGLIYVNKALSLSATKTNPPNFNIDKYWVNSPLKQTKEGSR